MAGGDGSQARQFSCPDGHDLTAEVCKAANEKGSAIRKLFRADRAPEQPRRIRVKCYQHNPPRTAIFKVKDSDCSGRDGGGA